MRSPFRFRLVLFTQWKLAFTLGRLSRVRCLSRLSVMSRTASVRGKGLRDAILISRRPRPRARALFRGASTLIGIPLRCFTEPDPPRVRWRSALRPARTAYRICPGAPLSLTNQSVRLCLTATIVMNSMNCTVRYCRVRRHCFIATSKRPARCSCASRVVSSGALDWLTLRSG